MKKDKYLKPLDIQENERKVEDFSINSSSAGSPAG